MWLNSLCFSFFVWLLLAPENNPGWYLPEDDGTGGVAVQRRNMPLLKDNSNLFMLNQRAKVRYHVLATETFTRSWERVVLRAFPPPPWLGSILRPVVGITCGLSLFLVPYSVAGVFVRVFCFASLLLWCYYFYSGFVLYRNFQGHV